MRKRLLVGVTIITVVLGASLVAAAPDNQSPTSGFSVENMIDSCRQVVGNFVTDGTLTLDQGKAMNEQMNNMAPTMKSMMGSGINPMGQPGMMGPGGQYQGMPCYENGSANK